MALILAEDSFITLADADLYFSRRSYSSAWTAATEQNRESALIAATLKLDELAYEGFRTAKGQALSWPRKYVLDHEGEVIPSDVIPDRLARACCELAFIALREDIAPSAPAVKRRKVGDLEVEYSAAQPESLPAHVRNLIAHLMRDKSAHAARLIA